MAVELKGLTKRSENYSQWYNELVVKADLAEQSPVRRCMVIKPYGSFLSQSLLLPRLPKRIIRRSSCANATAVAAT